MNEEAPERVRTRAAGLWSHVCGWEDLLVPLDVAPGQMTLVMGEGWTRRWSVTWRSGGGEVSCAVRDLAQMPLVDGGPTRWFSWRRGQRHRPGLQFLVSTGRHHGAESLEEARVLLALDFAGDLIDVVSQPLKLRFQTGQRHREHTPDFLAVTRSGTWLIDVRPRKLVRSEDLESFAATAEVALVCGWRYMVAAEWRTHVLTALDAFSAQRRQLGDPLSLRSALLVSAGQGLSFGELVDTTPFPPVARAQLLHLLWHRRLGADLGGPFGDASLVVSPGGPGR
ncbi:TnsA-like heteromeric transposase endonuclease subunit [Streptomyces goshikiensis]|uniref:TnsA-like heteromeric transposase endonuclease subunit n=1 Tax=Streptomyces goshikiensis TaxID=1942 RepID=UPI00369603B8